METEQDAQPHSPVPTLSDFSHLRYKLALAGLVRDIFMPLWAAFWVFMFFEFLRESLLQASPPIIVNITTTERPYQPNYHKEEQLVADPPNVTLAFLPWSGYTLVPLFIEGGSSITHSIADCSMVHFLNQLDVLQPQLVRAPVRVLPLVVSRLSDGISWIVVLVLSGLWLDGVMCVGWGTICAPILLDAVVQGFTRVPPHPKVPWRVPFRLTVLLLALKFAIFLDLSWSLVLLPWYLVPGSIVALLLVQAVTERAKCMDNLVCSAMFGCLVYAIFLVDMWLRNGVVNLQFDPTSCSGVAADLVDPLYYSPVAQTLVVVEFFLSPSFFMAVFFVCIAPSQLLDIYRLVQNPTLAPEFLARYPARVEFTREEPRLRSLPGPVTLIRMSSSLFRPSTTTAPRPTATPQGYEELEEDQTCIVCESNPRSHAILPCGHAVCCAACSLQLLRKAIPACPICRGPIEFAVPIHTRNGANAVLVTEGFTRR